MDLMSSMSTILFHNLAGVDNVENYDPQVSVLVAEKFTTLPSSSSVKPIPGWRLILSAVGPLTLLAISYYLALGLEKKIIQGLVRSSLQLMFLGYILLGFIFSFKSPIIVFAYLTVMILIAALEATSRQVRTYDGHYTTCLCSCFLGGGITGIYASLVVFHPSPWWTAKVMIPTAGMIIGNSVSGPAVATERLLSEVMDKTHEIETRLAFGASSYESILPIVRASVQAALLPTFNQMAIMGLVSIPGMMTGQLLGGTAPFTAAEYQMAILYLIVTTSAISTFVSIILTIRKAVFDKQHRLTKSKISKRSDGKLEIDVALLKSFQDIMKALAWVIRKLFWLVMSSQPLGSGNSYDSLSTGESTHGLVQLSGYHRSDVGTSSPDIDYSASTGSFKDDEETSSSIICNDSNSEYYGMVGRVTYSIISVEASSDNKMDIPENKNVQNRSSNDYHQAFPCNSTAELLILANLNVLSGESKKLFNGKGLDLVLRAGERITLEGTSGIGKTRLLRAISQLDKPIEGFATFSEHYTDKPLANVSAKQWFLDSFKTKWSVPEWRCSIIYIPQALPPMSGSPKELVKECLEYAGRKSSMNASTILEDLENQCKRVEQSLLLREGILSSSWSSLSGGERQRAAIALGLLLGCSGDDKIGNADKSIEYPKAVLLLDEPTAACDATTCDAVEKALVVSGLAMIIITHDDRQSKRIAHRRIILSSI